MADTVATEPTHPVTDADTIIDNAEEEEEDSVRRPPFCLVYAR